METKINSHRRHLLAAGGIAALVGASSFSEASANSSSIRIGKSPFTFERKFIIDAVKDLGLVADGKMNLIKNERNWHFNPSNGAKTSGTDNAPRLNKAIKELSEKGGGTIMFPPGTYLVSGVVLESNVSLLGSGVNSTILLLADNSNTSVIKNRLADSNKGNAVNVSILNMTVNGNRWGQSLPFADYKPNDIDEKFLSLSHGIFLHRNETNLDESIDSYSSIQNVSVTNTQGAGIFTRKHGGEVRVSDCYTWRTGGNGFVIGWDSKVSNCTSGQSEYEGFMLPHGSTIIDSCKSFGSGFKLSKNQITGIAYPSRASAGFYVKDVGHLMLNSINSQNNTGPGLVIDNASSVTATCLLDSNNMLADSEDGQWYHLGYNFEDIKEQESAVGKNNSDYLVRPDSFPGLELKGRTKNCIIDVSSWCSLPQNSSPMGWQRHAVFIDSESSGNILKISHSNGDSSRPIGSIIHPKTQQIAKDNNFAVDSFGNLHGRTPEYIKRLETPVVHYSKRKDYEKDGQKILDENSGKLIWYSSKRKAWLNTSDGKPA